MHIVIDSDASPIKDIAIQVAAERTIPVHLVASFAHYSTKEYPPHVSVSYVDSAKEAADYKIMQILQANDLLITQDYGLASLALGKNVRVLHHSGKEYTSHTIDQLLESRYLNAQMRKAGKRTKGPKPFTNDDKQIFKRKLISVLDNYQN